MYSLFARGISSDSDTEVCLPIFLCALRPHRGMPLSQCMHPFSARGISSTLRQRGMIPPLCVCTPTPVSLCVHSRGLSSALCVAPPKCAPLSLFGHFPFLTSLFVNTLPLCPWTQLCTLFRHSFSVRGSVIHSDPTELWPCS